MVLADRSQMACTVRNSSTLTIQLQVREIKCFVFYFTKNYAVSNTFIIFEMYFFPTGIVFSDYDEQLKLQRNISMVALRSLGYGKKSIENKIIEEARHLMDAFKVRIHYKQHNLLSLSKTGSHNIYKLPRVCRC